MRFGGANLQVWGNQVGDAEQWLMSKFFPVARNWGWGAMTEGVKQETF